MSKTIVNVRDKSSEIGSVSVYLADAADLDAWSVPGGLADAFAAHVLAMSIGVIASVKYQQDTQPANDGVPASNYAKRELGVRFYLRDQVTLKLNTLTIPAPDLDVMPITPNTDLIDLSQVPVSTFITWLEANGKSDVGNAIAVEKAVVVGRNN